MGNFFDNFRDNYRRTRDFNSLEDDEERQRQDDEDFAYGGTGYSPAPSHGDARMRLEGDRPIKKEASYGFWLVIAFLAAGLAIKASDDLIPPRGKKFSIDE